MIWPLFRFQGRNFQIFLLEHPMRGDLSANKQTSWFTFLTIMNFAKSLFTFPKKPFYNHCLIYPQTDPKRNSYCATDEDSWPHQWKLPTVGLEFVRKWYARDTGFKPRQPTLFTLNWRSTMVQWPSSLSLQDKLYLKLWYTYILEAEYRISANSFLPWIVSPL